MPILKHAIKKMRVDKRKTVANKKTKTAMRKAVKSVRLNPVAKELNKAFSALDRAAKKNIIHVRKADRLKSRLTRLVSKSEPKKKTVTKKTTKKVVTKTKKTEK